MNSNNSIFRFAALLIAGFVLMSSAGGHDKRFGVREKLTTGIGSSNEGANEVAIQADGKIVAAGFVTVEGDTDFAVVRYNTDGSLDSSFDSDGKVITSFTDNFDAALAVAIQADSKIVAAGVSHDAKGSWFAALVRYNTDGSLDNSFGSGGKVISEGADIGGIVIQTDGKIVADGGGSTVIRYNADGSLDASFGKGGFVTAGFGVWAVAVQPDGKVVVAGDNYCAEESCRDFALARFNPDGSLDTSFDSDGLLTTQFDGAWSVASSLILQPDGKIIAAGYDAGKLAAARYNSDGSLDASFDGDGKVLRPVDRVYWSHESSSVLQTDSKIVIGGASNGGQDFDFALVRLNTDGSLDTSFDADGKLTTDFGGGEDYAFDVAIQPNGKIVAVGSSSDSSASDFALARYNADGSLDSAFDGDGKVTTSLLDISSVPFDYDGDGKTDLSVYRPSNGTWYVARSLTADMYVQTLWSAGGLMPADYDGDGKSDIATSDLDPFDNNSILVILNSSTNTISSRPFFFGDRVVSSDFDGDGKADPGVWTDGHWQIALSQSGSTYAQQWGLPGDKPVPADFDGDGKAELAVWRPSDGRWYSANIVTGAITVIGWGLDGDVPVVGDHSGDGRADLAVYRPSNNTWYRMHSDDFSIHINRWGLPDDVVTPGDYDGDGRMDLAVWRPSDGTWYVLTANYTIITQPFGLNGDVPTPSVFVY